MTTVEVLEKAWPWFCAESECFDKDKLTRVPNKCLWCARPMIDVGSAQIIYQCMNTECGIYHTDQYLDPVTGKAGYDPYLGTVLIADAIRYLQPRATQTTRFQLNSLCLCAEDEAIVILNDALFVIATEKAIGRDRIENARRGAWRLKSEFVAKSEAGQ